VANSNSDANPSEPSPGAPPQGGALFTLLDYSLTGLNTLGSLWVFALMVLINIDAFGRTLFAAPVDGVNEMIELSIVGIVFMQLGDATRHGRLTRSDGFFKLMLRRAPRVGRAMGAAFDFIGIIFMVIVLYGSIPLLTEAIAGEYYVGNPGIFTFPVWPVKLVIVVGCLVTLLQFLAFGIRYLRPGDGVDAEPPASPEGT